MSDFDLKEKRFEQDIEESMRCLSIAKSREAEMR